MNRKKKNEGKIENITMSRMKKMKAVWKEMAAGGVAATR